MISRFEPEKTGAYPQRIVWVLSAMGYGPGLLYWGEILKRYLTKFPNSRFLSTGKMRQIPGTNRFVENKIWHFPRIGFFRNRIIALPNFLVDIIHEKPDLIIISEFGMLSLYVCMARWIVPETKVLLLVESDSTAGGTQHTATIKTILRRFICNKSDMIMTNNVAGYKYLTTLLAAETSKIRKAPYLTSEAVTSFYGNAVIDLPIKKGKFVFLFIGRLIASKGLNLLIDAVAKINKTKKAQLYFVVAGDGPYRDNLLAHVKNQSLEDFFCFPGFIPYEKLSALYSSADAFVFPTLRDYRALVGFEALSYGLPLLHSKWDGAVSEVLADGENGFIFDPQDTEEFAKKIEWFFDNRENLESFKERSLEISRNFTFDNAAHNITTSCIECLQYGL